MSVQLLGVVTQSMRGVAVEEKDECATATR